MSDEREELAWKIFSLDNATIPDKELRKDFPHESEYAFHIAEGLIESGYRKPRLITTPEELGALPRDSVVLSQTIAYQNCGDDTWTAIGRYFHSSQISVPANVIHEPTTKKH